MAKKAEVTNNDMVKGLVNSMVEDDSNTPSPIDNVVMTIDGNIMTIVVDLSKNYGLSGSGKSIVIASTEGNQPVPSMKYRNVKIGLNVYKPANKK